MAQRPLIGTSPNQVSTNGMLGDLAFQDSNGAYIETIRGAVNLDKLDKEITDTAVDIFVYDTRKDSDGGAWRKRTQYTSWYNETLNTATRGSRREFPAVAVIVAETTKVTIYDGDDPDLPMWMVINRTGITISSIFTLNGNLIIGMTNNAMDDIRFISDLYAYRYTDFLKVGYGPIVNRGGVGTFTGTQLTSSGTGIVNAAVNDVAMTVLPNAPIDDATGLPIPTIAVATNGGVSVIKDDGTVYDITATSYGFTSSISFTQDNELIFSWDSNTRGRFIHVYDIPSSDVSHGGVGYEYGAGKRFYTNYGPSSKDLELWNDTDLQLTTNDVFDNGIGHSQGLTLLDENPTSPANGLVAYATTSYNTGWMHGNIKGAFLSDTDATNVTGTELITNGTFDTDTSGWTAYSTTLTVSNNQLNFSIASGTGYVSQTITTTIGETYVLSFYGSNNSGTFNARLSGVSYAGIDIVDLGWYISTGYHSYTFTATSTTTYVTFGVANGNADIDNVSVRLAELDRSVNQKGLQVFGTVNKTAVATGAELVAYSNWSSSNYLRQPYNSDLDFGTGNWCYMFWYNPNDAASGNVLWSRWSYNVNSSTAGRIGVYFNSGNLRVDLTDDGASSYQGHFGSDGTQDTSTWHCGVILRRGNNLEIWIDGVNYRNAALDSNADGSYTNTSAILEFGYSPGMGSTDADIQLALFRASASAPSPEQIKKIYEDEKVLFQENAACTLYGSSDAVTALAYDEDLQLLHVGTSSGRSDFQGLRRINNTTTAVTTAISASNGLVAEQ